MNGFNHFMITSFLISLGLSSNCPSNEFVFCANLNQNCDIPGDIKSGYISYGYEVSDHSSSYVLIPFTNSHSNNAVSFSMYCNAWLGFGNGGSLNKCCYMSSSHDYELFTDAEWSFYNVENYDIPYPANKDLTAWRWGGNIGDGSHGGMYIYSVWSGFGPQNNRVSNAWMNPFSGLYSSWHTHSQLPTTISQMSNSDWTYCPATNICDISGGPRWVRYGNPSGDWIYKLVLGTTLNCNDQWLFKTWNTPSWFSGSRYCQKGPVLKKTFSHVLGEWKNCVICGGGCITEISITVGITNHEEQQLTDEWGWSLEATTSASYGFGDFSGSVELKGSISNTLTDTNIKSWTKTTETDATMKCADSSDQKICQFITNINEEDVWGNSFDFEIKSQSYWCLSDDGLIPQCPPGYCKDDDCQICSENLTDT